MINETMKIFDEYYNNAFKSLMSSYERGKQVFTVDSVIEEAEYAAIKMMNRRNEIKKKLYENLSNSELQSFYEDEYENYESKIGE